MKWIERLHSYSINDMDAYAELIETRKARDSIDDFMEEKGGSWRDQLHDLICEYGDGKEKQGFVNGFKYAFTLVLETFSP